MKTLQIEAAYINLDAIVAIVPDQLPVIRGIPVGEVDSNRCKVLLLGGFKISVDLSPDAVRQLIFEAECDV